jgi:hypothetical protein
MPTEFITLLKSDLGIVHSPAPIFDIIRPNRALYHVLENAFLEFDDGRGLERLLITLTWPNFRDRVASIYIYRSIHGKFPCKTDMELVEDIKNIETTFSSHSVHGISRMFLLGFYIRLANIQMDSQEEHKYPEIKLSAKLLPILKLSQVRTQRPDWLLLIILHFSEALGDKVFLNYLMAGKKLNDLYDLMSPQERELMHQNLLSYGASINESDFFLYEKV